MIRFTCTQQAKELRESLPVIVARRLEQFCGPGHTEEDGYLALLEPGERLAPHLPDSLLVDDDGLTPFEYVTSTLEPDGSRIFEAVLCCTNSFTIVFFLPDRDDYDPDARVLFSRIAEPEL